MKISATVFNAAFKSHDWDWIDLTPGAWIVKCKRCHRVANYKNHKKVTKCNITKI